jgi:hypothetical protein
MNYLTISTFRRDVIHTRIGAFSKIYFNGNGMFYKY